jgi:Na+/proline symporter
MLEVQEKKLRREKWYASLIWFYVVLLSTAFLGMSGFFAPDAVRGWFVALGIIAVVYVAAAVELVKYFISRSRVELLKEMKQLELQVVELRELVRKMPTA